MLSPIDRYICSLKSELGFDHALAQSVCAEVEDHLRESSAAYESVSPEDAETLAIERFGAPHALAAQFAMASLRKTSKLICAQILVVIGIAFAAMECRVAAITEIAHVSRLTAFGHTAAAFDRYAFWLALLTGTLGVAASCLPISDIFDATVRLRVRTAFVFSALAVAAILTSVAAETFLTAARVSKTTLLWPSLLPISLAATEIALGAILLLSLRHLISRAKSAWKLVDNQTTE